MPLDEIPRQQHSISNALEEALVIGGGSDNWMIQTDAGVFKANKAFSCLVCPDIGDRVLSVSLASGSASILAILERKQTQTTRLKFAGNVDISTPGSVRMMAGESLDAIAVNKISFDTDELSLRSKRASVLFDKLSVVGTEAIHSIVNVQILAKTIETVSETSKQVMKNSCRLISGLETVNAGEILQKIRKRFTLQSRQVSLLAEDDARLNGTRVHLG